MNVCSMKNFFACFLSLSLMLSVTSSAQNFVTDKQTGKSFPLVTLSENTSIYVDENDDWLVHKTASLLQNDIEMVTGKKPDIISSLLLSTKNIVIIGTI